MLYEQSNDILLLIIRSIDATKGKSRDVNIYSMARTCKKIYEICKNNVVFNEKQIYYTELKNSILAKSVRHIILIMKSGTNYDFILEEKKKMPLLESIFISERWILREHKFNFNIQILDCIRELEIHTYMISHDLLLKLLKNDRLRSLIIVTDDPIYDTPCVDTLLIKEVGKEYKRIIITTGSITDKDDKIEEGKLKYGGYIEFSDDIKRMRKLDKID
jgi:hypothetical protein